MPDIATTKTRKPRKDKGMKRNGKIVKIRGVCLFSGSPTKGKKSRFLPGNDAKLKSVLIKVHGDSAPMGAIPRTALDALKSPGGILGFKITDSGTLRKVGD
jgi:hypothetical protein